jgi:hypothetical protein
MTQALWGLEVNTEDIYGDLSTVAIVPFLPTGEVDIDNVNLSVVDNLIWGNADFGNNTLSFWRELNFVLLSNYWMTLYDLGQISSVVCLNPANLSDCTEYPSSYNIFVNNDLFQSYSSYFINTTFGEKSGIKFLPLNDVNRLQPVNTTILRSYSCSARQIKGWFNLFVSVFAANFTIFVTAKGIVLWVAAAWQNGKLESRLIKFCCADNIGLFYKRRRRTTVEMGIAERQTLLPNQAQNSLSSIMERPQIKVPEIPGVDSKPELVSEDSPTKPDLLPSEGSATGKENASL